MPNQLEPRGIEWKETVPSRDRQFLRELATFPLTLERFADHPEFEAQFLRDALPVSEADLWTDDQP